MKLFDWQQRALAEIGDKTNYAIFAEMGTGKTFTMIRLLMNRGFLDKKVLITSPLVTLYNWKNEFKKFSGVEEEIIIVEDMKDLSKALDLVERGLNRVVLINYEKISLKTNPVVERLLKVKWDYFICDESHYLKNPSSNRTKVAIKIAKNSANRFIMSGTPVLKNCMDLWSQFMVLDSGESFGVSFNTFKFKYFFDKNASRAGRPGYFPDMVFREEKKDEIKNIISQKSIVVKKDECLDLPPLIKVRRECKLDGEALRHYKTMKKDFVTFVGGIDVVASIAMVKILRLSQICSGFLPVSEEESEEVVYTQIGKHKLQMLREELENFDFESNKLIIWTVFRAEMSMIRGLLDEMAIPHARLDGQMDAREKSDNINSFEKNPEVKIMLANSRAGGIGVNLTSANTSIYFSRSFDLAVDLQSEARNYRSGSEKHKTITRIDLVVKDSVDELILEALNNKSVVANDLIEAVKKE